MNRVTDPRNLPQPYFRLYEDCFTTPTHLTDSAHHWREVDFPAPTGMCRLNLGNQGRSGSQCNYCSHLLGTKEAYNESVFHKSEADTIRRAEFRLLRQAAQLGFQIISAENGW